MRDRPSIPDTLAGRLAALAAAILAPGLVLALGSAAGAGIQEQAPPIRLEEQDDDYEDPASHPAYVRSGPHLEGYSFTELPLDPDSPFYPSSATTRSGGFYSQAQLMDVERCGDAGCHPDIYGMWFESTHHLASMSDPWYRRTVQFIQDRAGIATSQWCGGCHDPALMMTGRMQEDTPIEFGSAEANIGISCQFCHSVSAVHPARANGSYTLAPAAALPHAGTDDPELRRQGNAELLASPELIRRHKARRRSYFHTLSEFCGTCHKQSLITPVNNYKWFRGFDEYDGWQVSGVSGAGARSFYYPDAPMTCQDCHMPDVPSDDAGNDGGMVASHRFLGANTALSAFHGYDRQLEETVRFLQDDQVRVDLFGLLVPEHPAAPPDELVAPAAGRRLAVAPGIEIGAEIVVRTLKLGHAFTGGTSDSNMVWLEVTLLDAAGEPVLMSGGMGEDRFVDEWSHFYRGVFLDEAGQEISKRNGWDRRAAVYVQMIPPGAADTVHYRFAVPEGVEGPVTLRARLNYRKHKQSYNRWALGAEPAPEQPEGAVSLPRVDTRAWVYDDSKVMELPVVVMAEDELQLELLDGDGPVALVDGVEADADVLELASEHRTRFNDYGIGLLRQGDLRGAERAFRWVQEIDPGYADGFVNEARAHLQEGNLPAAEAVLERALELQPGWFKASYFMAQVARGYGEYERAAELLESVIEEFPYDRAVRVDLGNVYYLLGRYEDAVEHLLHVIDTIDPEELGAHYNLMLVYRAMGEEAKAEIHESRYRRYKEDEDIRQLTGPFKRAHPAVNNEAQAIHVHRLEPPGERFSAAERFPWTEFVDGGRYDRPLRTYPGPTPPWERTDRATVAGDGHR